MIEFKKPLIILLEEMKNLGPVIEFKKPLIILLEEMKNVGPIIECMHEEETKIKSISKSRQ